MTGLHRLKKTGAAELKPGRWWKTNLFMDGEHLKSQGFREAGL